MKLFLFIATSALGIRFRVDHDIALKIRNELNDIRTKTSDIETFKKQFSTLDFIELD